MKRKVLSLIIAAAMTAGLLSGTALADSTDTAVAKNATTDKSYEYLDEALDEASSGDTIYVLSDCELEVSGTVKSGVTLVVPSSSSLNDTTTGNNASGSVTTGSAYATLTIPTDVTLTVNGSLLVAGNQQSGTGDTGCLTGDYGAVALTGNLTVENGGVLYARGEISGSGSVTANSGSTVYQMFQIHDWRGGTATISAYSTEGVFPFNLYEVKNITADTTYYNGSTLYGQYYVTTSGDDVLGSEVVIGANGQYEFSESAGNNDNVLVSFSNGKSKITVNGDVTTGGITVTMTITATVFGYVITSDYTVSSAGTDCPVGYNMDIEIANGATLTVNSMIKVLPGCTVTVKDGGSLVVNENCGAYFYAENTYSDSYFNASGINIASGEAVLSVEDATDVSLSGFLGSTSNTYSNLKGISSSSYATDTATVNEVTQSGTSVTKVPVPFNTLLPASTESDE